MLDGDCRLCVGFFVFCCLQLATEKGAESTKKINGREKEIRKKKERFVSLFFCSFSLPSFAITLALAATTLTTTAAAAAAFFLLLGGGFLGRGLFLL